MGSDDGIEVLRSADRFVTHAEGRTTWHSFSFGVHYDPANLGFGAMVAHNDENLPPGTGYPAHPHRDTEIVTWVLEGALRHVDDAGNAGVLLPGEVQRVSAGSGIVHSETTEPGVSTRFLQTWLRPDVPGGAASYAVERAQPGPGVVDAVGPGGLRIGTAGARLSLLTGVLGTLALPEAPRLHVFLVAGRATLGDHALAAADGVRITDRGGQELTAHEPVTAAVWAFGV